ncbi:hypothetical protein LJC17_03070 [Acholeplasma sp. OttesenSCG-928-E16]|nr:hypothetical protein [Acholeplasma sp. OttesenSCG-928-E16]
MRELIRPRNITLAIMAFCAIFVVFIFTNYKIDLIAINKNIVGEVERSVYDSKIVMNNIIILCCAVFLGGLTVLMMLFSVRNYLKENEPQLGILKALGYRNIYIAVRNSKTSISILIGSGLAYISGLLFLPTFYKAFDGDIDILNILPVFHIELLFFYVIMPFIFFFGLSIFYNAILLRKNALDMIKQKGKIKVRKRVYKSKNKERSFLIEYKKSNLKNSMSLIIFVFLAAFCYSAEIQMAVSMLELESAVLFSVIIGVIGILIGLSVLFISISFVIDKNKKNISMFNAFGYTNKESTMVFLDGFRKYSYIGFVIGTGYQYMLLKLMYDVIFNASDYGVHYRFSVLGLIIALASFIILYEGLIFIYKKKLQAISLKQIMSSE